MIALVLNAGSSSLKASLYDVDERACADVGSAPPPARWEGVVEWVAPPAASTITIRAQPAGSDADAPVVHASTAVLASPVACLDELVASIWRRPSPAIDGPAAVGVVGHRVVYGGAAFTRSTRLTAGVRDAIARAADDAPSHNALELAGIDATLRLFGPTVPQVAVFDTAFHATLPPRAYTYAGPYEWLALGVRRYGFHGVSHAYASHRTAHVLARPIAGLRVVTAHLGSGCSLAAVRDGASVDTTMGFTPTDGVPMATRSGAVDPGILLHLLRHQHETADSLERVLNKESGLAGLSGVSSDVRAVLAAAATGHARAQLAIDVYVYRIAQAVATMAVSLGGLDALVFTAGVGEHSARVRADVCRELAFLGVALDPRANDASGSAPDDRVISDPSSRVAVLVVRAAENWVIAQDAVRLAITGP